ncbi:MAG: hypothetical protein WEE03_05110 [Chloroflexota bacterium]
MRPVLRAVAEIVISVAASLLLLISGHGEAAVIVLNVFVLIVTTILLQAVTIRPAELSVQRHRYGSRMKHREPWSPPAMLLVTPTRSL